MDLSLHIYHLLYRHDCVVVPGFGGLVCTYKKVEFNPHAGYILPARKTVSFNQNLTQNDSLLANYIDDYEKTGLIKAVKIIEDFVSDITRRLENGQVVKLENIGNFALNPEKKIVFIPDQFCNFLADSYGLGVLQLNKKIAGKAQSVPAKETQPAVVEPVGDIEKPKSETALVRTTVAPVRRKNRWTRRIVAGLLILILVTAFFVLQDSIFQWRIGRGSFLPMSDSNPAGAIKESVPVSPALPPAEQQAELQVNPESSQNHTITQPGVETSVPVSSNSDSVFYIIAGAFKSGRNAGKLRAELEQKGYSPHIIKLPCSSLLRVGYRQYATRREAHDQLNVIRKEDNNPDAWVLAVKK